MGFHLCLPKPPIFYSTQHCPLSPLPSSRQLHAGSCSPHPGSGAWGYSTAPDYRCSWSRPPDGSQGHTGNPPGLRPELGGPHPSGTPSHFPGSNKTWSRFGLGKDKKREVGWRRLLPLRKQKPQVGGCALKHPTVQEIEVKGLASLASSPPLALETSIHPNRGKEKALPCRNPRWSYIHIKCHLLSGWFSGFEMCGCM